MAHPSLRSTASLACLVAGAVALAGCFGPTYGTGKTASDQLLEDLGNSLSLRNRNQAPPINYSPRPDIIAPTDTATLPPPQENIVDASDVWPESPEQRRARVRREIDEGQRDPNFITNSDQVAAIGASEGPSRTASGGARRVYLTDPPAEYRQPAETAAYGDLGPTEAQKERAAKRASDDKPAWRRWLPF